MKLKLAMALSAACLFISTAGAEAVTLSAGNEMPTVKSARASRSAASVEGDAPLIILLAVDASAARG